MMKQIYLLFVAFGLFAGGKLSAQAPPEIIHYMFNGTSSLVPNLATNPPSGTSTGTIMGTLTQGGTGQEGTAIVHTGSTASTDYVNTGWTNTITGSWSIAFWTASVSTSSTLFYLFGNSTSGTWRCFTNGVAGSGNWILRGTGLTDMLITGGATMTPQHNIFVYDAANSISRTYLNGVLQQTVSQSSTVGFTATAPFKVAGYATNVGLPAGGLLDEFRIYSRALNNYEAQQIYSVYTSTNVTASACGTYTSPYTGTTYSTTAIHTQTFSAAGGISTVNINLTMTSPPTITLTPSATSVCPGAAWTTTASGATSYSWSAGLGTLASAAGTASASTIYTVTGSLSANCASTATLNVVVNGLPTITLVPPNFTLCPGASWSTNASGASSYSWGSGLGTQASAAGVASTSAFYTVTGLSSQGCAATATVGLLVKPNPTVAISASGNNICDGQALILTASGANAYNWSTGDTAATQVLMPTVTAVYSATGTTNGCVGSTSISIQVSPSPTLVATITPSAACVGQVFTVSATGANSYIWSNNKTGPSFTETATFSQTYAVIGQLGNCQGTDVEMIIVNPNPNVSIFAPTVAVCSGQSLTITAAGAQNYTWSSGGSGNPNTITPTASGPIIVTGYDSNNCSDTAMVNLYLKPSPTPAIGGVSGTICAGESITVTATGGAGYSWNVNSSQASSFTYKPAQTTTITVTATGTNQCVASTSAVQHVDECIGITQYSSATKLSVYPNPGNGIYTIETSTQVTKIKVYNSLGAVVMEVIVNDNKGVVDLRSQAPGLYYFSTENKDGMTLTKVVKE